MKCHAQKSILHPPSDTPNSSKQGTKDFKARHQNSIIKAQKSSKRDTRGKELLHEENA